MDPLNKNRFGTRVVFFGSKNNVNTMRTSLPESLELTKTYVTLQPFSVDASAFWSGLVVLKMLQLLLQKGFGHAEVDPCKAWKPS